MPFPQILRLIVRAILAKEIAKNSKGGIQYPLLVASAYSGFIIWHSGLSGSIPLSVAAKEARTGYRRGTENWKTR